MNEISAMLAASQLKEQPAETILLDVREPQELDIAAVDGALHIPMAEIPARLAELDKDQTVICMCHLGGRSAQVTAFLTANGFANAVNLTGGISAWSVEVDPNIPIY